MKFLPHFTAGIGGTIGLVSMVVSFPYIWVDLALLNQANTKVMELKDSGNKQELDYYTGREIAHRINVFANVTWFLLGTGLTMQSALIFQNKQHN